MSDMRCRSCGTSCATFSDGYWWPETGLFAVYEGDVLLACPDSLKHWGAIWDEGLVWNRSVNSNPNLPGYEKVVAPREDSHERH